MFSSGRGQKYLISLLFTGFILYAFSGCAKPPLQEIADAEAALEKAREAEAPEYAPETFKSAEEMLTQAKSEMDEKQYKPSRNSAIKSRNLSNRAVSEAERAKAAAREEGKEVAGEEAAIADWTEEQIGTGTGGKGIRISSLMPVYFAFDEYVLTASARETLKRNAEWLKEHPDQKLMLEGHCDEWGSSEYNIALGDQRAQSVRDFLVYLGVEAGRLSVISYGEEYPADTGHTREAWSKNRRVDFVILP